MHIKPSEQSWKALLLCLKWVVLSFSKVFTVVVNCSSLFSSGLCVQTRPVHFITNLGISVSISHVLFLLSQKISSINPQKQEKVINNRKFFKFPICKIHWMVKNLDLIKLHAGYILQHNILGHRKILLNT